MGRWALATPSVSMRKYGEIWSRVSSVRCRRAATPLHQRDAALLMRMPSRGGLGEGEALPY
eukprot:1391334-Prymnesium_polylepis.1